MRHKRSVAVLAAAIGLMVVAPAQAAAPPPPTYQKIQFEDVVEAEVAECDRTLRWDIDGTVRLTTFFDGDGDVRKTVALVTELNTITDVDNDVTLREGPDVFTQTTTFNDDGTQIGLSVLVRDGVNPVIDLGRLKVLIHPDPSQNEVLIRRGRHDIRGIDPFLLSADPVHLKGFCPAFV